MRGSKILTNASFLLIFLYRHQDETHNIKEIHKHNQRYLKNYHSVYEWINRLERWGLVKTRLASSTSAKVRIVELTDKGLEVSNALYDIELLLGK